MTRETKIGLLVGLAFIIVIGILLSDHMTSATEPPLAPMQIAAANVRNGLGQPASENSPPIVVVPPNITPQPINLVGQEPIRNEHVVNSKTNNIPSAMANAAHQQGEDIVDVSAPTAANQSNSAPVKLVAVRTYKAESGDSLTRIATKMYGTSTRANRDAIVAANPALKDNPNKIIVGKSYVIPPANTAVTTAEPVELTPVKVASEPQHTYVVQSGDTLWSIAVDELGNANTIAAIKELNRDVLKNGDRVRPNMKLRLPAKPVASAE